MNFQTIYKTRGQKDDKGYPLKTVMFGVLDVVGGFEKMGQTDNYKSKCKVTDDTGKQRTVTFMGKDLPQPNMLGHRVQFACWAEEWFSNQLNKNMTSFSAWLQNANVTQTPPRNTQQAPSQPPQATNSGQGQFDSPNRDKIAEGKTRSLIVANAIGSGQLKCSSIQDVNNWLQFCLTGQEPTAPVDDYPVDEPPVEDDSIPF